MPHPEPIQQQPFLDLRLAAARVHYEGRPSGTAFLVGRDRLVTARHVLGRNLSAPVEVEFPALSGFRVEAEVDTALPTTASDVIFLKIEGAPDAGLHLWCGPAMDFPRGLKVRIFGFPLGGPAGGQYAFAEVGATVEGDDGGPWLQLARSGGVTGGFSGGPVVDEATGLLVGMAVAVDRRASDGRGGESAFIVPASTLFKLDPTIRLDSWRPFKGLASFTLNDAGWYYGRQRAIDAGLNLLAMDPRFLAVLGPSGSGKSSLIQAGLLPKLQTTNHLRTRPWDHVVVDPSSGLRSGLNHAGIDMSEGESLESAIHRRVSSRGKGHQLVVVVDPLEKLLRPGSDGQDLTELAALLHVELPVTVIIALRNDFYARLSHLSPELRSWVKRASLDMPETLSRADLESMVEGPLGKLQYRPDPGLTERLFVDAAQAAPAPAHLGEVGVGVLPLLEFTLAQLWAARECKPMSHEALNRIGGLAGGISQYCDDVYRTLPARLRPVARRILTELVEPGDSDSGILPTRRLRTLPDLVDLCGGRQTERDVNDVVDLLTHEHRLLVTRGVTDIGNPHVCGDDVSVELIHEALAREWPTLAGWLRSSEIFRSWRTGLEKQIEIWKRAGHDKDILLRGSALTDALDHRDDGPLAQAAIDFIQISERAAARSRRRARAFTMLLVVAVVVASALAIVANLRGAQLQKQTRVAQEQTRVAAAEAALARSDVIKARDPATALRLVGAAATLHPTPKAVRAAESQLAGLEHQGIRQILTAHDDEVLATAFRFDARVMATSGKDGKIALWDVEDPARTVPIVTLQEPGPVSALDFSPDGHLLATGNLYGPAKIWLATDVTHPRVIASLPTRTGYTFEVRFLTKNTLAAVNSDATVGLWDVSEPKSPIQLTTLPTGDEAVSDLAFDRSNHIVRVIGLNGTMYSWDISNPSHVAPASTYDAGQVMGLMAASPDGHVIVTSDGTKSLVLQVNARARIMKTAEIQIPNGNVTAVSFDRSGRKVALGTETGYVSFWDLTNIAKPALLFTAKTHTLRIWQMSYDPTRDRLASASWDKTVTLSEPRDLLKPIRVASLTPSSPSPTNDASETDAEMYQIGAVAVTSDGHTAIAIRGNGTTFFWDVSQPSRPIQGARVALPVSEHFTRSNCSSTIDGVTVPAHCDISEEVTSAAFLPGRSALLVGSRDVMSLWDISDLGLPRRLSILDTVTNNGDAGYSSIDAAAVSSDGELAVTATTASVGQVWSLKDPSHPIELARGNFGQGYLIQLVKFSPKNRLAVIAGTAGPAQLWSFADPAHPRSLATLGEHTGSVVSAAFSPDGTELVTGGSDGIVVLWDLGDPQAPKKRSVIDLDTGATSLSYSPNGRYVAGRATNGIIDIWDVSDTENPLLLTSMGTGQDSGHNQDLSFMPDSQSLIIGQTESMSEIWSLEAVSSALRDPLGASCTVVLRGLSRQEWTENLEGVGLVRWCG